MIILLTFIPTKAETILLSLSHFKFKNMALISRIVANIYGKNGNATEKQGTTPNGRLNYFSNSGNMFYPAPAGTAFNGITCNSIIEVYSHGLNQKSDFYAAVETVAQLVTNGI